VFGADGRFRQGFSDYLESSYGGKGSPTHFKKIMGVDLEEIEGLWNEHVESIAAR
jgi:hypothetical protein